MKAALACVMFCAMAVVAVGCGASAPETTVSAAGESARAERGRYLVSIMGCNDCHTPWKMGPKGPEPDMERMLSGHPEALGPLPATPPQAPYLMSAAPTNTAWVGPWGVAYTANLTPDRNTGLGIWTEEMFMGAIRTGRHMGTSRPINPPMPWPAYRNATDEDLKSIFAYLRTIKPIVNHVPDFKPIEPAVTTSH